jgi:hypothetical protein
MGCLPSFKTTLLQEWEQGNKTNRQTKIKTKTKRCFLKPEHPRKADGSRLG